MKYLRVCVYIYACVCVCVISEYMHECTLKAVLSLTSNVKLKSCIENSYGD